MPHDNRHFAIDCQLDYELAGDADFVFQIHASDQGDQTLLDESLVVQPASTPWRVTADAVTGQRRLRLRGSAGPLSLHYRARVAIAPRTFAPTGVVDGASIADLPDELLPYLLPTRYCESDLLSHVAWKLFGALPPGEPRARAIVAWAHEHVEYLVGWSISTTTARDVFVRRAGVCRDFAHLCIALCRGLNIPARLVAGYSRFAEPPPDFHAVFEAWVGGRWLMFDPTRLARVEDMVRIAHGSDAKDVAFCTIFGAAKMLRMQPCVTPLGPLAAEAPPAAPAANPADAPTPT
jgi:transglutaminase-like putative cysteine protease